MNKKGLKQLTEFQLKSYKIYICLQARTNGDHEKWETFFKNHSYNPNCF